MLTQLLKPSLLTSFILTLFSLSYSAKIAESPNGGILPQYSPDGKYIAFLSSSPHLPKTIWIMNVDGTTIKNLSFGNVIDFTWANNSSLIKYTAYQNGNPVLFESPITRPAESHRVSALPEHAEDPVWSSDGQLIAYMFTSASSRDLWIVRTDGSDRKQLTADLWVQNVHWINNNKKIIFQVGQLSAISNAIMSIDIGTKESQMLYHGFCNELSVAHNQQQLAFPITKGSGVHQLVIMNTDTTKQLEFDLPRNMGSRVEWSPDDTQLIYIGKTTTATAIWSINADGTQAKQITPTGMTAISPRWSVNGKKIVFAGKSSKSFSTDIFTINRDGTDLKQLTQSSYSQWAPVVSPDGRKVAFFTNQTRKANIQICSLDGKTIALIQNIQPDYTSRLLWSSDMKKLLMICQNRIEVFDVANPVTKKRLRFPTGLISAVVNYRDGRLAVSVIKSGSPHILVGNLNNDSTLDVTELRTPNSELPTSNSDLFPQWSPKGKQLAFIRNGSLWTMNDDGTNAHLLFSGVSGSQITHQQYAPRGNQILVTLGNQIEQNLINELWLINPDGSNPKLLFQESVLTEFALFESDYTYPATFTPDGNSIIYTSDADGKPNVWRFSIPDEKREKLTRAGAIYPNYLPDTDILIYTSLSGNKERIAVLDLTGKKNEQLLVK